MRLRDNTAVQHVALMGCLIALCFGLSYLEFAIPLPIGFYGVKLGLSNIVILFALYRMRVRDAFLLSVLRILLVGFTFGNLAGMLYSLCGGMLSLLVMAILQRIDLFSVVGVSVCGGVAHNLGQLLLAIRVTDTKALVWYFPVLLLSGVLTGILTGITASLVLRRTDLQGKKKEK